ncbi:unnamed protein product [Moneuplotes crassus]|uniref:Uncharacterized protein n=1 Tax=Euplotes crassus TaxID=5936 RepID=A0AAD1U9U2_EUPCR|nr:unnamed protein product [Moneuplotes crassus]
MISHKRSTSTTKICLNGKKNLGKYLIDLRQRDPKKKQNSRQRVNSMLKRFSQGRKDMNQLTLVKREGSSPFRTREKGTQRKALRIKYLDSRGKRFYSTADGELLYKMVNGLLDSDKPQNKQLLKLASKKILKRSTKGLAPLTSKEMSPSKSESLIPPLPKKITKILLLKQKVLKLSLERQYIKHSGRGRSESIDATVDHKERSDIDMDIFGVNLQCESSTAKDMHSNYSPKDMKNSVALGFVKKKSSFLQDKDKIKTMNDQSSAVRLENDETLHHFKDVIDNEQSIKKYMNDTSHNPSYISHESDPDENVEKQSNTDIPLRYVTKMPTNVKNMIFDHKDLERKNAINSLLIEFKAHLKEVDPDLEEVLTNLWETYYQEIIEEQTDLLRYKNIQIDELSKENNDLRSLLEGQIAKYNFLTEKMAKNIDYTKKLNKALEYSKKLYNKQLESNSCSSEPKCVHVDEIKKLRHEIQYKLPYFYETQLSKCKKEIHKLQETVNELSERLAQQCLTTLDSHLAKSIHIQTEEAEKPLGTLIAEERHKAKKTDIDVENNEDHFMKRFNSKNVYNSGPEAHKEVVRLIKKYSKSAKKVKCILTVKQVLEIAGNIYKRNIQNEAKDTELMFILYDELIAKHKNKKIALRYYEQFLIGLNNYSSLDIRVSILKRFLICNNNVLSHEIVQGFYVLIKYLIQPTEILKSEKQIDGSLKKEMLSKPNRTLMPSLLFTADLKKCFVDTEYLKRLAVSRIFQICPKKFISKLNQELDKNCKIFLNGRLTYIPSSKFSYYALLREIKEIIIVNGNTSVGNAFKMFFSREDQITQEQLHDFIKNEIMADVGIVEKYGRSFSTFFKMFFDKNSTGSVMMGGILNAFHDNVELKISIDHVFKIILNYIIDLENFFNFELTRVYKNNQISKGGFLIYKKNPDEPVNPYLQWTNLSLLSDIFTDLCPDKSYVQKALEFAKEAYSDTMVDYYGMKFISKKYKLFEPNINEIYKKYYIKDDWEYSSESSIEDDFSMKEDFASQQTFSSADPKSPVMVKLKPIGLRSKFKRSFSQGSEIAKDQ